jgi:hypothetical protein
MFYRPGGGLSAYRRLVAMADARLVRRAVGVWPQTGRRCRRADGGRRNRDSLCQLPAASCRGSHRCSCQQPRVAALSGGDWSLRRRSTASPPIRSAQLLQLLQLLLSVFYSHSPRADCAPHQQDTCSCKQCENLVAPLSGGAALEEAAAWEAQQMEAARHAKELQSQYWGRQRQQRARRDWRRLSG